jgi:predicted AAA+ superfamily ATPase
MNMIPRLLKAQVTSHLQPQKAVLIFGPRRVGKTVLMRQLLTAEPGKSLFLNGEDYNTHALLEERTAANYRRLLDGCSLFALDEAQNIDDIGQKLKLIVDEVPGVAVLASGSSSFDLLNKAGEPLVGRATRFLLTPFSQAEIAQKEGGLETNFFETRENLETRLIYGSYPEVVLRNDNHLREEYLTNLVNSYLLKDILVLDGVKNSGKMQKLLRLVAFQVGQEASLENLAGELGLSKNTVEKYLDLLSKVFVIFRLGGFARNLRKEVTRAGKWYFWDTGVRNAIIGNFKPLALRSDTEIGGLWENYCISERRKKNLNEGSTARDYYWRTYDGQEIDLIEEKQDETGLSAWEFKWGKKSPSAPDAFAKAYPGAPFQVVNRENYLEFAT